MDAPFAWHQRSEATKGIQFTLPDLIQADQTLNAYIDALRIAYQAGASLQDDLDFEDWGAIFISTVLGLMLDDEALLNTVLSKVSEDIEHAEELEFALRWPLSKAANKYISQWQTHNNPAVRRAALGALYTDATPKALHGELVQLHTEIHPLVLTHLFDIAGDKRQITWRNEVSKQYDSEAEDIRFHAIRAGTMLGDSKAFSLLHQIANTDNQHRAIALELILRAGNPADTQTTLATLLKAELSPYLQCQCIGWAGYPEYIPLLIRYMTNPLYTRTAGYAFSLLTGIDIMDEDLVLSFEDEEAADISKTSQDKYRPDDESDWFWPCPEKIQTWWQQNAAKYPVGTRHLAGLPITQSNLDKLLLYGTQPQRQAAALERSFLKPHVPIFDVKAYAVSQQKHVNYQELK